MQTGAARGRVYKAVLDLLCHTHTQTHTHTDPHTHRHTQTHTEQFFTISKDEAGGREKLCYILKCKYEDETHGCFSFLAQLQLAAQFYIAIVWRRGEESVPAL